ncbi:COP9 signalosome complex subunit 8 [Condylostylus longicornis]|uniref:COP9 signalosome complex subunit 8 n=1 Tax=Condylostylus longicornis TaxID=2530218 RepID=UPI00244DE1CA|nr:COP9 signalosome complex subunit 8 [Condylostylus longicornis]
MQKFLENIHKLEDDELENGTLTADGYGQLFSFYLLNDDLSSSKFLWKRIPNNCKGDKNLERLHKIYLAMWNCQTDLVLKLITSWEWPNELKPMISELEVKIKQTTLNVIGNAYTTIFENNLCQMTWLSPVELEDQCNKLNWNIEKKQNVHLIYPKRPVPETIPSASSENQLFTLTDFVSFLEN